MAEKIVDSRTELAAKLEVYLCERLGSDVTVESLSRLAGGASHETWAFDAQLHDKSNCLSLVMRRDFENGLLDGNLGEEFALMLALYEQGIPVPMPRWCVTSEPSPLGTPFMIMDRAGGVDVRKAMAKGLESQNELGVSLVAAQAAIHALDFQKLPKFGDASGDYLALQIEHWCQKVECHQNYASPLLVAAINWLRKHIPKVGRLTLVHGDFKANNLLCLDGKLTAVIDWEMAHIGDPLEDIAWTLLWRTRYDLINGMFSEQDYFATYEKYTGVKIDPARLGYWRIFSLVKLSAIFLTGMDDSEGQAVRPVLMQLGRSIPFLESEIAHCLNNEHSREYGI